MAKTTRPVYCRYPLSSPINYTITHFADHSEDFSYDMINRYLAGDCIPSQWVWANVKPHQVQTERGYVTLMIRFWTMPRAERSYLRLC